MGEPPKDSQDGVDINVSADSMSVMLVIRQGANADFADIIRRIRDLKVARFDDGIVIEALDQSKSAQTSIEVARGVAPVDDHGGKIEFQIPFSQDSASLITMVEVGQTIGQLSAPISGTDGCDVFGKTVERRKVIPQGLGRNIHEENGKLISHLRGNLRFTGNILNVEPLLEVRADAENVAPITFEGDVLMHGNIRDGRNVQITGCLSVEGTMEAIQLTAGASVAVQGGIVGNQKGKYIIGGDLRCRSVTGGFIIASKDIHVQSNISDARITCGGRLQVAQGLIFGGVVAANSGLTCATLGHPGGVPTLIEAGEGIAARAFQAMTTARITANQKRIQIIRARIAPLMKIMKTLTPQQREKATELLYEADELEVATGKLITDQKTQTTELHDTARAEVTVSKMIHPGVTVRFPTAKTTFTSVFKGPFTLVPRQVDNTTQVVLIDGNDQSVTALPTIAVEAEDSAKSGRKKAA